MTPASADPSRVQAAERRARSDAAQMRERARHDPQHPARMTRPRANPDVDRRAMEIGIEKLRSVIAK